MIRDLPQFTADDGRDAIRAALHEPEAAALAELRPIAALTPSQEAGIWRDAGEIVSRMRGEQHARGGIDALLQEFSLSSDEGVALMCLAESLLRIPDAATQDRMIQDVLGSGDWSSHLGQSDSLFVNASAWGLLLTGRIVNLGANEGRSLASRAVGQLGEPVIRRAMRYAMHIMGTQFVMAADIEGAVARAGDYKKKGYGFSYDMLGEGARTMADADSYFEKYLAAIDCIGKHADCDGISVKLSALHPRYELKQHRRAVSELLPRLQALVARAAERNIQLTVDAEESHRLDLSLELVERAFMSARHHDWDGFGFALQAYQKQGIRVAQWAVELARRAGRRLGVRLVKGAYWDSEIKWAQEGGHASYPVFTEKSATDVSYHACAVRLLANPELIYPQFATHNAYTVATVRALARTAGGKADYEFQRLHGMGEELYDNIMEGKDGGEVRCRVYAPVGDHADLIAYLVRRMLENGANTSFVNNIHNREVPIDELLENPLRKLGKAKFRIPLPGDILAPRQNSMGMDLADVRTLQKLAAELRVPGALLNTPARKAEQPGDPVAVANPADLSEVAGFVSFDNGESIETKISQAVAAQSKWREKTFEDRASLALAFADTLERHAAALMAVAIKEAGKTLDDAQAEVREAVDFCRYYASTDPGGAPLGTVLCISPWNFPVAIFTGQAVAALLAGNTVIAKPAEQTPLAAQLLVRLMVASGIPQEVVALVLATGDMTAELLVEDKRIDGVVFTGSTATARDIASRLCASREALVPLIAETGGVNGMIVDSTALVEQVADDVVMSAFRSAGQRCSALRILYAQEEIAGALIDTIKGKMAELVTGDPARLGTDVGPVIDAAALERLQEYVGGLRGPQAKLAWQSPAPDGDGHFFPPTLVELSEKATLTREVFGPVLHVKRFKAGTLGAVVDEINAAGYGLTFGVHSRIASRGLMIAERVKAGNVYINRNMIGAMVGVQPFGGMGKSGTGPKAGGPDYLKALVARDGEYPAPAKDSWQGAGRDTPTLPTVFSPDMDAPRAAAVALGSQPPAERVRQTRLLLMAWVMEWAMERTRPLPDLDADRLLDRFGKIQQWSELRSAPVALPSPTGETNELLLEPRGIISVVAGQLDEEALLMISAAVCAGNVVLLHCKDALPRVQGAAFGAYVMETDAVELNVDGMAVVNMDPLPLKRKLLEVLEAIVPVAVSPDPSCFVVEKTITTNIAAAGGNATLLMGGH